MQWLEVLAILKANSFHSLKKRGGGVRKVLLCLEGGGDQKVSARDFTIL